ncbi:MAG: STAS domain-containing protein [Deltaproteobacteria bacterium]|nr:STAS domain-containing protein [Deltaproteobacteria bacterium]
MECTVTKQDEAVIVKVTGRMDAVTAPEFEQACVPLIESGAQLLIVDLAGLEYISSAGLRSILSTAKKLKAVQGQIRFCNLAGMVQEVFSMSGFDTMFTLCGSLDEALK